MYTKSKEKYSNPQLCPSFGRTPMGLFSNSIRRFQLFHKTREAKGESNIRWVKFVYAQEYTLSTRISSSFRYVVCRNGLKSLQGKWM